MSLEVRFEILSTHDFNDGSKHVVIVSVPPTVSRLEQEWHCREGITEPRESTDFPDARTVVQEVHLHSFGESSDCGTPKQAD